VTDAELVERLKANDDDAYREVVSRFGDALYGYIYGITGDHHLSEDVISETYLRMVERIDSYTFYGAPFRAWLYRIAHNLAINALKRRPYTVPVALVAADTEPSGGDPAATVGAQLEAEELRAAIAGLTEDQQQVVLMRFVGGHTHLEVARALEKTETAVKQLQLRALRSLGRMLGQGGAR
jgi:RNA polymerase sigma-70 factor, ECF subfamily